MILHKLPADDYHADEGLGASGISLLRHSPAHYRFSDRKPTKALDNGHALHMAILEPDRVLRSYAAMPPCDRRTKAGKAIYTDFLERFPDAIIISNSDYQMFSGVAEAAKRHPTIQFLTSSGQSEVSIFADHPDYGIRVKCRPDWYPGHIAAIPDIKTTEDARPWAFGASVYRYGYHRAAAHYMDVIKWAGEPEVESFFLIAVEKSKPYGIMVYELDAESIAKGRAEHDEAYRLYAECLATNSWP